MKTIMQSYPNEYGKYDFVEYQPLLESFEYTILTQVDTGIDHGDSFVFYQDSGRYGYLSFGWGSSSGSDALQSCKTIADATALQTQLLNEIIWFDTAPDALTYFQTHDWRFHHFWIQPEFHTFVDQVIAILTAIIGP